jgi:hypothetical protein
VAALQIFVSTPLALAQPVVSCRLVGISEQDVRLEVLLKGQAPTTVIVLQYLPLGSVLTSATPPASSYDSAKGLAKWLLTRKGPGSFRITYRLADPIRPEDLRGEIRYRDPATGAMVTAAMGR